MARNYYIRDNVKAEQNLYEDLVIESLKIYGQDVYYLPRETVFEDRVLVMKYLRHIIQVIK